MELDVDSPVDVSVVVEDEGGLEKPVPGTILDREVEVASGNVEATGSDLKRGREGDDWACLNVDPKLADHSGAARDAFVDTSSPDNAEFCKWKDRGQENV